MNSEEEEEEEEEEEGFRRLRTFIILAAADCDGVSAATENINLRTKVYRIFICCCSIMILRSLLF